MQQIIKDAKCDPATGKSIILSYTVNSRKTRTTSIQMVSTADQSGVDTHCIGWLQGSNDNINWFNIAKLETQGQDIQYDGGPFEALWESMIFRLEQTENATVDVFITQREA
ncbi:MAG: hypothetical protein ACRCWQ_10760 [Bacilli bacterium]